MRHKNYGNQLGRPTNQAKALYASLVRQLLVHHRIETTLAKAKAVRGLVDKTINLAKKNTISSRREVAKVLPGKDLLDNLFSQIAPGLTARNSGYTRIIRLGQRFSDTAEKVIFELVELEAVTKSQPEEKKPSAEIKQGAVQKTSKLSKPAVVKAKRITTKVTKEKK